MKLNKSLDFLTQLRDNNCRDWFNANRAIYTEAKLEFEDFVDELIPIAKRIDPDIDLLSAGECTFRIFRDVRFARDKSPYKTNFGAFIAPGGRKSSLAGFYVHMEPDASFVGGGAYMPASNSLKAMRTAILEKTAEFKGIIEAPEFRKWYGELWGEKLKTAPRGFPKDFPDIDLLRHKHYVVAHNLDNALWDSDQLVQTITKLFEVQAPLHGFLNAAIARALNQ